MKLSTTALGLALVVSLVMATSASAHVTANPAAQEAGAFTKIEFRVPNEQDKPTTSVDIQVPEGASFVSVQPVDGWKVEAKTVKLDKPEVAEDGDEVTERTSEIVYTGGTIEPGQFQSFYVSMKLPANGEVGDYLFFPTVQTYEGGEDVNWVQKPKEGADPFSLDNPAPFVELGAAASDDAGADDDATTGGADDPDSSSADSTSSKSSVDMGKYATDSHVHDHVQKLYIISIAALVIAVLALAMAVLRRPRRP